MKLVLAEKPSVAQFLAKVLGANKRCDGYKEEESRTIDEEFLAMLLYLMMSSMNQTDTSLPLTPDGNLTLVDDIGSSTGAGQQFITMVTKSGNCCKQSACLGRRKLPFT